MRAVDPTRQDAIGRSGGRKVRSRAAAERNAPRSAVARPRIAGSADRRVRRFAVSVCVRTARPVTPFAPERRDRTLRAPAVRPFAA
jgi:hypothetical protein